MIPPVFGPSVLLVVDIGGTNVKFGVTIDGNPLDYMRLYSSDALRIGDPVVNLAALIRAVIVETAVPPELVVATVPGFIDTDGDRVLYAANIPELNGRQFASELSHLIKKPVLLERDSVLALLGESFAGAGRGTSSLLGLFFGTGVGAAFIHDGRPFRGAGWALEIGHMPFKGEGRRIDGSRPECLEDYVSGRALRVIADNHGIAIESLFELDSRNIGLARELDCFVRDQAFAIGVSIALFSPEVVVLGGGICAMKSFPKEHLAELVRASAPLTHTGRPMNLRWAELGWRSVLHGAARIACENVPKTTGYLAHR